MLEAAEIRSQVECILRSDGFAKSPRLTRFLRYLVETAIEGRTSDLKEYALGVEVFERGPEFDPRMDTLVRSTARHLRLKLDVYYHSAGRRDRVVIELPKGGYVPQFRYNAPARAKISPPRRALSAAGVGVVLCVLTAAGFFSHVHPAPGSDTVAVLPFDDRTGAGNHYAVDGIREEISDALVRIPGLLVVARTSALAVGSHAGDVREIGARLRAAFLVTGFVESAGENLRITAQLWDTRDGRMLWSGSGESAGQDARAAERAVVTAVAVRLERSAGGGRADPDTSSAEAHDLYVRGRYFWYQRDADSLRNSVRLFQQAVDKDPDYALAYAGLADAYGVMAGNGIATPAGVLPLAETAAKRALALDPDSAPVHASLGLIRNAEWDWTGAERELRRALELNPGYAAAYQRLALNATVHGRFAEAESLLRRAQLLDPLNWMATYSLGENAYYARRYDVAIGFARQLQVKPAAANLLHRAFVQEGRGADALAAIEGEHGVDAEIWRITLESDRAEAARKLRRLVAQPHERIPPCFIAESAARLGDREFALEWLEQAYRAHDPNVASISIEPDYDSLRGEPRFRELIRKVGF